MHDPRSSNDLDKNKGHQFATKMCRETKKNIINKLTNPGKIYRYVHNFMAATLASVRSMLAQCFAFIKREENWIIGWWWWLFLLLYYNHSQLFVYSFSILLRCHRIAAQRLSHAMHFFALWPLHVFDCCGCSLFLFAVIVYVAWTNTIPIFMVCVDIEHRTLVTL